MTQTSTEVPIDEAKLGAFMGKVVTDLGALISAGCVLIGDKLGLYRAMADGTPVSSEELAKSTDTTERYVREWLVNQAASGYLDARKGADPGKPDRATGRLHVYCIVGREIFCNKNTQNAQKGIDIRNAYAAVSVGGVMQELSALEHQTPLVSEMWS